MVKSAGERTYTDRKKYLTYEKTKGTQSKYRQAIKLQVLTHYGQGLCQCVQCGFDDIRALSLDHIDGKGSEHRKSVKKSGQSFYRMLKKQGYPVGYQTLCMNCQWIKRFENGEGCRLITSKPSDNQCVLNPNIKVIKEH